MVVWETPAAHATAAQHYRSAREPIDPIVAIALAGIVAVLICDAATRGPWLDEFWTLELSDPRRGLDALIRDGWLRDTHPPLFNAWATLLSSVGVTSIPVARLASNLPAVGLLILAAVRLSQRSADHGVFCAAMVLLTLALPQSAEAFADYRSYFWQITAFAVLILIARHVALADADLDITKECDLAAIAIVSTMASVTLHYVGGLFGALLAAVIALCAIIKGHRRWALLLLTTASISSAFLAGAALIQAPAWMADLDHNWIEPDGLAAIGVPGMLIVAAISTNPVPLAGIWMGRGRWCGPEIAFCVMVAGVITIGLAIVLAFNAYRPIIVDRYILAVPILVCAIMAGLAAKLSRHRRLIALLVLVAVGTVVGSFVLSGARPQWEEGARSIARIVADCPTTRVYAASGWALGPAPGARSARREDPVFARAYDSLATRFGFAVTFIAQNSVTHAVPEECPVLLWFEHTPNGAENRPRYAVSAAGLKGLEKAGLSTIRTATGLIVRGDRQDVSRSPDQRQQDYDRDRNADEPKQD